MNYTKEHVEKEVAQMADEYAAALQNSDDVPEVMKNSVSFQHIWAVGYWLQPMLEATGMTQERASTILVEHGQRSFHTNPYEVAAWILNGIQAGTFQETPMEELAPVLLEEHTRTEIRDGKKTCIITVWNPEVADNLSETVERIRSLPSHEREAEIAKLKAELADFS